MSTNESFPSDNENNSIADSGHVDQQVTGSGCLRRLVFFLLVGAFGVTFFAGVAAVLLLMSTSEIGKAVQKELQDHAQLKESDRQTGIAESQSGCVSEGIRKRCLGF